MSAVRFAKFFLAPIMFIATSGALHAQGLFDVLFNSSPQPQQYYRYAPAEGMRFGASHSRQSGHWRRSARSAASVHAAVIKRAMLRKKAAAVRTHVAAIDRPREIATDAKPVAAQNSLCCQSGGAIEHIGEDKTLRKGDAVMTPDGLKIYSGRVSQQTKAVFIEIRKAKVSRAEYSRLTAVTPSDTLPEKPASIAQPGTTHGAKAAAQNLLGSPSDREKKSEAVKIRTIGPYRIYHQSSDQHRAQVRAPKI